MSCLSIDDEYREIELYLKQAQDEIGQALSSLTDLSEAGTLKDKATNPSSLTNGQYGLSQKGIGQGQTQSVDFLSIFAQNDLIADHSLLDDACSNSSTDSWNNTLPGLRRRAERPKTLTPPPKLPNCCNFKKQDWKVYVKGDYNYRSTPNNIGKDYYYVQSTSNLYKMDQLNCNNVRKSRPVSENNLNAKSNASDCNENGYHKERSDSSSSGENISLKCISNSCGRLAESRKVTDTRNIDQQNSFSKDVNRNKTFSSRSMDSISKTTKVDSDSRTNGVQPVNVVKPSSLPGSADVPKDFFRKRWPPPTTLSLKSVAPTMMGTKEVGSGEGSVTSPLSPCVELTSPTAGRRQPVLSIPPPPALDKHETRLKVSRSASSPEKKLRKRRSRSREKSRSQSPESKLVVPSMIDQVSDNKVSRGTQTFKSTTARLARGRRSSSESSLDRRKPSRGTDPSPSNIDYPTSSLDRRLHKESKDGSKSQPAVNLKDNDSVNDIFVQSDRPVSAEFCEECQKCAVAEKHKLLDSDISRNPANSTQCNIGIEPMDCLVTMDDQRPNQCDYMKSADEASERGQTSLCVACNDKCNDIQGAPVVLVPSRESRRVRAKPQMPVIVEDVLKSNDEASEEEEAMELSSTPSSTLCSQNSSHHRSLSSSSSTSDTPHSPEHHPVETDGQMSQSISLLDTMHKKFYPKQYSRRLQKAAGNPNRVQSAEALLTTGYTNTAKKRYHFQYDAFVKSATVPHAKSASFAGNKNSLKVRVSPDRLSDRVVIGEVDSHKNRCDSMSRTPSPYSSSSLPSTSPEQKSESSVSPMTASSSSPSPLEHRGEDLPSPSSPHQCTDCHRTRLQDAKAYRTDREQAEIEAVEACKWLRAAGFPQYAQMYEDQQFPIDITSVEKDHDFLDQDSIQSLFRRLNTLNKCATMKIEAPPRKTADDSDDEEQCALSDKWKYQRSSRRWSRRDLDMVPQILSDGTTATSDKSGIRSCSSHDSVITDIDESLSQQEDSPTLQAKSQHNKIELHITEVPGGQQSSSVSSSLATDQLTNSEHLNSSSTFGALSPSLRRAASEKLKGAKNFLKRMESLKSRKSQKKHKFPTGKVEISGPVLVENGATHQERMDKLGCVDIASEQTMSNGRHSSGSGHLLPIPSGSESDASNSPGVVKKNVAPQPGVTASPEPTVENHLETSPKQKAGPRKNHSTSNIHSGALYTVSPDYRPGRFPKLISNGYLDIGNGSQVNCRTGSFSMGYESEQFRESLVQRRRKDKPQNLEENNNATAAVGSKAGENRLSIYDNVPFDELGDPQQELDKILKELYSNINGLNQLSENCSEGPMSPIIEDMTSCLTYSTTSDHSTRHQAGDIPQSAPPNSTTTFRFPVSDEGLSQSELGPDRGSQGKRSAMHVSHSELGLIHTPSEELVVNAQSNLASEETDPGHVGSILSRSASPSPSPSNHDLSDADTPESREEDGSDKENCEIRERRDSGVGSSLTRAPSDRRRQRIRWHSFVKYHRPSFNSRSLQINNMSAGQLMLLRKLSLLKITAQMERYSPSNRSGWNWMLPKFIKKLKAPDYRDKNVFGVPLSVVLQRSGQPLPQCILFAMRCLRRTAMDAVGIFRKSGVRSRIQKLRNDIEADPESTDFESLQAYDVADLLKQYFRELPECLLTNKLSETFISIFTHVPGDMRLEALQSTTMLLPDENREVLQSLLFFLSDMAEHSDQNQMTASNLAVCFAPSLFHMCGVKTPSASPKRNHKAIGIPDQKELLEQKAAHECLTEMIKACKKLFVIPEEMLGKCRLSYLVQGDPVPLEELGRRHFENDGDHTAYLESCIQGILKESRDRFKGWVTVSVPGTTDLAYKKVGDGHPLRLWKCSVEVAAPPVELLNRVMRERHLWDEDMLKWRVVEKLDSQTEVFQYVLNSMAPHPTRDFCEIRSWRTELPKGSCVLVSTSVEHGDAALLGGVRAVVLASRYLIEPCGSGKSRLTHICRVDIRGHTPEWYNKSYGHICVNYMNRIKESFTQPISETEGPETRI